MSDASKTGYGQASYLRLVDERGQIHCSFVAGKVRVTPRKTVSIPRLELAAATVSVRVADMLKAELDYEEVGEFYWTDSEVVLGFINNESRRFHVYVANRVQLIRDHTLPEQWRHVGTSSNPADEASRGITAKVFLENSKWLTGPDFLWQTEDQWPQQRPNYGVLDNENTEVKKINTRTASVRKSNVQSRLERFSSWTHAKRAVAHCRRYMQILKAKANARSSVDELPNDANQVMRKKQVSPIGVEELEIAESVIVTWMQRDAFSKEIEVLESLKGETNCEDRKFVKRKKALMKGASGIFRLDPFLDHNGTLRVGGRLIKANMSEIIKHPIIFPRNGHLTTLLIRHFHAKVQHSGRGITFNEIRASGYWVGNGNAAVRSIIAKCVTCRHLRGSVGEQKMANLPESRLEPSPPFTYCAMDYFGPLLVKQGRKELKRYGALFTCMASRAVHIEVSDSLETDSFLQALRRFVARRGPVREIRSDHGTNFIGAINELRQAYKEMDDDRIKAELLKNNIDWALNPPAASHFGGVWERQIRSVRSILSALMKEHGNRLNDEGLRTLLCEAEAIINSRPLTIETLSDPFSLLPLTPALLTGKSKVVLPPPGKFQRPDLYCKRRWRQVQHITNEFWKRWQNEFLAAGSTNKTKVEQGEEKF